MVSLATEDLSEVDQQIVPKLAIVLHGNDSSDDNVFNCATRHPITDGKLGLGSVTSIDQMRGIFKTPSTGLIPDNVLIDDAHNLVWYTKRKRLDMWFRLNGDDGVATVNVEWPPMVYAVTKAHRKLFNFTLPSNTRPTLRTRLYHSPLMNISSQGSLCLGTAVLPDNLSINTLKQCEAALTDSQFTHTNHDNTLKGGASDRQLFLYWKEKQTDRSRVKISELTYAMPLTDFVGGLKV